VRTVPDGVRRTVRAVPDFGLMPGARSETKGITYDDTTIAGLEDLLSIFSFLITLADNVTQPMFRKCSEARGRHASSAPMIFAFSLYLQSTIRTHVA
jgi:hypothetical protein